MGKDNKTKQVLLGVLENFKENPMESMDIGQVEAVYEAAESDRMLYKPEAMILNEWLQQSIRLDLEDITAKHRGANLIIEVDALHHYIDIWDRYARPGTYQI